ncbi:MAG: hypothetical protein KBD78_00335 [Oligoflexales bacterium]|nr:hypothetical protein [Oligoflexales bacterium]
MIKNLLFSIFFLFGCINTGALLADSTSASVRQNKNLSIEGRLGFIVGAIPGTGAAVTYHMFKDFHIGASHVVGAIDLVNEIEEPSGIETDTAKLSTSVSQIYARYFLGNSFYLSGGFGQRTVEANVDVRSTVFDTGIEGSIEASSSIFNASLGNVWSWDSGFFFGCEWVGVMAPFANSNSGELTLSGTALEEDEEFKELKKDTEDLAQFFGESTTASLFVVQLGWAF